MPAGRKIGHALIHQHTAGDRPDRFHLSIHHDPLFLRGRAEFPGEFAIARVDAINPAIVGTKEAQIFINGRWGVDPSAGRECPPCLSPLGVQSQDAMFVGHRHEHLILGNDRRGNDAFDKRVYFPIRGHRSG